MRTIIAAFLFVALGLSAGAETLTVTPGTKANLQALLDRAQPGDVVELTAGTYRFSGGLRVTGRTNVTIRGQGRVELVIDSLEEDVIAVHGSSNIVIRNLSARHNQPAGEYQCEGAVIRVEDSNRVGILQCDLNGCGAAGVMSFSSQDVVVAGCRIHHNTFAAVWVQGGSVTVYGNTIEDNAMTLYTVGDCDVHMLGNTVSDNDAPPWLPAYAEELLRER